MPDLASGQRVPLAANSIRINIDGPRIAALGDRLGAAIIALTSNKKLPESFAPTLAGTRELRPGLNWGDRGSLSLELDQLPADVDRILVVPYIIGGMGAGISFIDFGSLDASISDWKYRLDLTNRGEAAVILAEIYRHSGGWRLAANGQGFVGGLGAAASALGVHIDIPQHETSGPNSPPDFDYGRPPPSGGGGGSTGSGFAIDHRHILTNAHVIDGSLKIKVASDNQTLPAEIIFSDPHHDIAMLRVAQPLEVAAQFRAGIDLHLGEDIIVLGFPLQGLLGSGPQVTAGNISSLCGIGNDTGVMQFTAPIASGNSGGPILDSNGLIIGLVQSSLNVDRVRSGGGSAENVNFGVKASIVRTFLAVSGIEPVTGQIGAHRSRADIVRDARGYLYRILCDG